MNDREKTMRGLYQHCKGSMFDRCGECPYYDVEDHEPFQCRDELLHDALKLLEDHEAETVKEMFVVGGHLMGKCPKCSKILTVQDHPIACGFCGQAVIWHD